MGEEHGNTIAFHMNQTRKSDLKGGGVVLFCIVFVLFSFVEENFNAA